MYQLLPNQHQREQWVALFDFGQPYNATFEGLSYGTELDYMQLPILFETYSPADAPESSSAWQH
jgi:hypothetical protein